jgi:hemerythrin superfamily protein
VSTDAIVMLKEDHKEIKRLFRAFEAAGDSATKAKGDIVDRILEALTVHTYIENEGMYSEIRNRVPELETDILESYEEHHVADVLCMELAAMPADADRYDAKVTVLIESVEHHIDEEEESWFPKVRDALGRNDLREIGARLLELREKAPHRPAQPGTLKKVVKAIVA